MRRHQFKRFSLSMADAPRADQAVKQAALEARAAVNQALVALQLCTGDQRVPALADAAVDTVFTLHDAVDQDAMDRRAVTTRPLVHA